MSDTNLRIDNVEKFANMVFGKPRVLDTYAWNHSIVSEGEGEIIVASVGPEELELLQENVEVNEIVATDGSAYDRDHAVEIIIRKPEIREKSGQGDDNN